MDPDTSKKVNDLLSLMEDISSDVDTQTELEKLLSRIQSLEDKVSDLTGRLEQFEKAYLEKQQQLRSAADDLKSLFPSEK
jgi:chromosome segregation ATPase